MNDPPRQSIIVPDPRTGQPVRRYLGHGEGLVILQAMLAVMGRSCDYYDHDDEDAVYWMRDIDEARLVKAAVVGALAQFKPEWVHAEPMVHLGRIDLPHGPFGVCVWLKYRGGRLSLNLSIG